MLSDPHDSTAPPEGYTFLIRLDQCPTDRGVFLEVAGRELAVFHLESPRRVYVIDNTCPHAGGNLAAGSVSHDVVKCPWHGWAFHLADGRSAQGSLACVRSYPVILDEGNVYARLTPDPDPAS